MKNVNDIRQGFLDFFKKRDHTIVPSAPLVPMNDPTLMFVNAGMVPFKNVFTGSEKRDYVRAASSQKCVRAGGKHNDLDNVGYTARHHTFFEMLGNFSFGDYFKEQAIINAWDLITKTYGIDAGRLTVTVYHTDDEAFDLWKKVSGFPDERIIRIATNDNFWAMGDTGPCGPCSEIFYDHGKHIAGGPPGSADEDGDRFVEIWNLVFMQFEQMADGSRRELPKPSIDTGMGLERIAAVLQGTHDNYEIDTFRHLIAASVEETGVKAEGAYKASHRVIADHLRAGSFLIADGVLPSNEGRGYVLRRIMRRAMRHAHLLGAQDLLMYKLVPALIREMGHAYPELGRAEALIAETLKHEEERFRRTLERGLKLLDEALDNLPGKTPLPGDVAFKLYDTYGFPLDLTEDALRSMNRTVDTEGFKKAMEKQRSEARKSWAGSGEKGLETVWFDVKDAVGATDFLGYEREQAEAVITAIVKDGKRIEEAKPGDFIQFTTNQTPFYGESGGQEGDKGIVKSGDILIRVKDTQKPIPDMHVHIGTVEGKGSLKVGTEVSMEVQSGRRTRLRSNHSATHLLHEALRRELGDHVTQKGSLVAEDRLRFDISHPKAITPAQLAVIEQRVNEMIRANTEVGTRLMTPDDAVTAGALALFGEKYGDEVRVVSMGVEDEKANRTTFSVELCGGTHVRRTGDIGLFKIISESAVSSGVRRIEAMTGEAARQYFLEEEALLKEAAHVLKASPQELPDRIKAIVEDRKALEKEVSELRKKVALGSNAASGPEAEDINDVSFLAQVLEDIPPKDLRGLADQAKKQLKSGVVAFVATNDGKAAALVAITDDLTEKFSAVDLVQKAVEVLGGKGGGGRPDMAQGGGPDVTAAKDAIDAIRNILKD